MFTDPNTSPIVREMLDELAGDLDLHVGDRVTFNGFEDYISAHTEFEFLPLEGVQGTYMGVAVMVEEDGDPENGPHVSVWGTMVVLTDDERWIPTDPKSLVEYADAARELY